MQPPIQRTVEEPERVRVLAKGTTVPTSWTTVYTPEANQRTSITWISFVSTDSTDYTLQIRLQDLAGTNIEIAQAMLVEDGEQWRPVKEVTRIPLITGWNLQIIGSGAGTINVHYLIAGVPSTVRKTS